MITSLPPAAMKPAAPTQGIKAPADAPIVLPPPDEETCRAALRTYLERAAVATGESARSGLLADLVQQLCAAKLDFVEDRAPDADCYVRVRGKDRVILGQPGQAYGSAVLVFQDDLGRAGRADEARQQLRRYLSCLWSMEPAVKRRNYLCLATDGFRLEVSSPTAPEPGRPTIVPGEISLKRLTLMDIRTIPPADLCAWLGRVLCRRLPLVASPANFLADFGAASHVWQTACPELTRLWARLAVRPDCQEAFAAWRRATIESVPPGQGILPAPWLAGEGRSERFVVHSYLAMVARLVLMARLCPAGTPGAAATVRPMLDGSACAALGIHGVLNWPLLWWTTLPEAGDAAAVVATALAGLLPAYAQSDGHADALDALCAAMGGAAYRQAVTTPPPGLARLVVDRLFNQAPAASLGDPACGHGAFLRAAVARRRADDGGAGAAGVLSGLAGLERDPLAATVAQVGVLLSLGDLSVRPAEALTVPVYWRAAPELPPADTEGQPGRSGRPVAADAVLVVGGRGIRVPAAIAADEALCRLCLRTLWPLLSDGSERASPPSQSALGAFLWLHHPSLARELGLRADLAALAAALCASGVAARGEAGLQEALAAVPLLFMRGRFQAAVARSRPAGRATLDAGDAPSPPVGSSLGAAWDMVCEGGSVACVLPRSAMGSRLYQRLRGGSMPGARAAKGKGAQLGWWELWDLEAAAPQDARPLCVFFGERLPPGSRPSEEAPGLLFSAAVPARGIAPGASEQEAMAGRPVRYTLARQRRGTAWSTESVFQPPLGL